MRKLLLPFLLVSIAFVSCKKETESVPDMIQGQGFFPTDVGKYIVYNYDSTIWDDLNQKQHIFHGQLRYDVTDTFINNSGQISSKINVQRRGNDTDPYVAVEVIYVTPSNERVIVNQNNLNFIKLTFPINNGKSWNGNSMIPTNDDDYAEFNKYTWNYTYANFDQPYDLGIRTYDHTVTVNQIDESLNNPDVDPSAYAYRNYSQEVYAYKVGMIYKERIYWVFQPKVDGSGGSGFRKGYSVVMKAVDHN